MLCIVIVWMDSGKELSCSPSGPWTASFPLTSTVRLDPIFQYREHISQSFPSLELDSFCLKDARPEVSLPQSIHHMHEEYGRSLRSDIAAYDVFYALYELFEFSAASIDQLLELFEGNIRGLSHERNILRLSELLVFKASVDDYRSYVKDILEFVRGRGNHKWPHTSDSQQRLKAERVADRLTMRYQYLLRRCERLSEQFSSSITILTNMEAHHQTTKAIEQTDRLGKLSFLAYVYIPITFAASFFGMNFAELGTQLSLWTFFVVAIPLLIMSLVAWFVDIGRWCRIWWRVLMHRLHIH